MRKIVEFYQVKYSFFRFVTSYSPADTDAVAMLASKSKYITLPKSDDKRKLDI